MDFAQIDFSNLPPDRDRAFVYLESKFSEVYEEESRIYQETYRDIDGGYVGTSEPERTYVTRVLAILDEYDLPIYIPDITDYSRNDNQEFNKAFMAFRQKIGYTIVRLKLRKVRMEAGTAGTAILIRSDYKNEIGKHLTTIRKIVDQKIANANKKDAIFRNINSLQSEIDRDQTTIDIVFGRALDLSETIGKFAENLEPAIEKMERIKSLLWDNGKRVEALTDRGRPKLIEDQSEKSEDDIPF